MATHKAKRYSEGGEVPEQSGGLAGMIQDSRRKSAEQGVVRTKAPFKAMQPGLDRIVGAMERKVASQATKNRTTQGATQTSDAGYKRGGRVGEPNRPQKTIRAAAGGAVLSSGKTVDSTHDHLMKQGKAAGFRK